MISLTIPYKQKCIIRMMNQRDALSFTKLLYSVYGKTYTYKDFYQPDKYINLINSKNVLCYGCFNEDNELIGHTALRYNKKDCSYYSFLSMKKWTKKHIDRDLEKKQWKAIINQLSSNASLLYQNTTTSHLLAQKYASTHLLSNPIGFIFNYTNRESYKSIKTSGRFMHSLIQITQLKKEQAKKVTLFDNWWTNWIKLCYSGMGFEIEVSNQNNSIKKELIIEKTYEDNKLEMVEYTLKGGVGNFFLPERTKTTLFKIPINNLKLFNKLTKLNFIPVGIKINLYKNDELVLQLLTKNEIKEIIKRADSIALYSTKAKQMLRLWIHLVLNSMH